MFREEFLLWIAAFDLLWNYSKSRAGCLSWIAAHVLILNLLLLHLMDGAPLFIWRSCSSLKERTALPLRRVATLGLQLMSFGILNHSTPEAVFLPWVAANALFLNLFSCGNLNLFTSGSGFLPWIAAHVLLRNLEPFHLWNRVSLHMEGNKCCFTLVDVVLVHGRDKLWLTTTCARDCLLIYIFIMIEY